MSRFLSRRNVLHWELALGATAAYYPDDERACAHLKEWYDLIVTPAHLASLRYERAADFERARQEMRQRRDDRAEALAASITAERGVAA